MLSQEIALMAFIGFCLSPRPLTMFHILWKSSGYKLQLIWIPTNSLNNVFISISEKQSVVNTLLHIGKLRNNPNHVTTAIEFRGLQTTLNFEHLIIK